MSGKFTVRQAIPPTIPGTTTNTVINADRVTGLATPISNQDATNKEYVDAAGGNDTEVQYNDSGVFVGSSSLTWNSGTTTLNGVSSTFTGAVEGLSLTDGVATMTLGALSDLTTVTGSGTATFGNSPQFGTFDFGDFIVGSLTVTGYLTSAISDGTSVTVLWPAISGYSNFHVSITVMGRFPANIFDNDIQHPITAGLPTSTGCVLYFEENAAVTQDIIISLGIFPY